MFCIKCGVELSDSEESCPLCGTRVYHPDIERKVQEPAFPVFTPSDEKLSTRGLLFIVTTIFAAVIAQLLICEFSVTAAHGWAGYAIGGVVLVYILIVLPMWFRKPNLVIFVPCDFAAILLYLLYIDILTEGHWFLSFAFPAVGALALIATAFTALLKYVKRGHLYIWGGTIIANGLYMVLLELLINYTFRLSSVFKWSYFPLFGCFILGMGLIVIAICKPIREALKKKFFL